MSYTKQLTLGGILAGLAVLFQIAPVMLTEVFVPITIFSTVPIYLVSRINPKAGFAAYVSAALVIAIFSVHEGVFFLCTNGLVGLSLGVCAFYTCRKITGVLLASLLLTAALEFVTYVVGIPVFGFKLQFGIWLQAAVLFIFSVVYNIIWVNVLAAAYGFCSRKLFKS